MCKGIFPPQISWEMGESWDLINIGKLIRRLIAPTPRLIHLLLGWILHHLIGLLFDTLINKADRDKGIFSSCFCQGLSDQTMLLFYVSSTLKPFIQLSHYFIAVTLVSTPGDILSVSYNWFPSYIVRWIWNRLVISRERSFKIVRLLTLLEFSEIIILFALFFIFYIYRQKKGAQFIKLARRKGWSQFIGNHRFKKAFFSVQRILCFQ